MAETFGFPPVSEHRQALMAIIGKKMRLDQAIADLPVQPAVVEALEGITALIADVVTVLQKEAIRKEGGVCS